MEKGEQGCRESFGDWNSRASETTQRAKSKWVWEFIRHDEFHQLASKLVCIQRIELRSANANWIYFPSHAELQWRVYGQTKNNAVEPGTITTFLECVIINNFNHAATVGCCRVYNFWQQRVRFISPPRDGFNTLSMDHNILLFTVYTFSFVTVGKTRVRFVASNIYWPWVNAWSPV